MQEQLQDLQYRLERAERRFWLLGCLAVAIVVGAILMTVRPAATAQSGPGGIPARVEALETKVTALQAANAALQTALENETAARKQGDTDTLTAASENTATQIADEAAARQNADTSLQTGIAALQTTTQFISVVGGEMYITGTNVHIVNGLGSTNTINGFGNLTVGYNARGNGSGDIRTGSHNIVAGDANSYSAYGGLVVGKGNTISDRYASISGGGFNTASGAFSSVSGGNTNTASGNSASVSGGNMNTANAQHSSVSGGVFNTAGGIRASVSGGLFVRQSFSNGWAGGSFHSP